MTEEQWRKEAKRYSQHIWCYPDLIDDFELRTKQAISAGEDPYTYVEELGEAYDLDRADQNWGIHSGMPFRKANKEAWELGL